MAAYIPIEGIPTQEEIDRFWVKTKLDPVTGCLNWMAAMVPDPNYFYNRAYDTGRFRYRNRNVISHRFALYLSNGFVDPGPTVDHLCHNSHCCNPDHLRGCPQFENNRRRRVTLSEYCKNGHLRTLESIGVRSNGKRFCRVCSRLRDKERYQEKYAKEKSLQTHTSEPYAGKLSLEIAEQIRKKYSTKEYSYRALAREFCVSSTMIRLIIQNKCWKEIN